MQGQNVKRDCVEVETVSLAMTGITTNGTKSAFCALHSLHEISMKLTRRRCDNRAKILVFRLAKFAKRFKRRHPYLHPSRTLAAAAAAAAAVIKLRHNDACRRRRRFYSLAVYLCLGQFLSLWTTAAFLPA